MEGRGLLQSGGHFVFEFVTLYNLSWGAIPEFWRANCIILYACFTK